MGRSCGPVVRAGAELAWLARVGGRRTGGRALVRQPHDRDPDARARGLGTAETLRFAAPRARTWPRDGVAATLVRDAQAIDVEDAAVAAVAAGHVPDVSR